MSKPRFFLLLSMLVVLGLMITSCYREAAPDVTPTPAGGAQVAPPAEEGMPNPTDMAATAEANSTLAAQPAEGTESTTVSAAPTQPPATATPPPPVPATPVPATPVPATPTPNTPAPTAQSGSGGQVTHVVQRGENLFRIALRYNTTVQAIANANGIANPAMIYVGQKLLISSSGAPPAPSTGGSTYTVQPGDNLFRIALRYNLSYLYLAQYNGIANPSSIYVGQVLRIPPH